MKLERRSLSRLTVPLKALVERFAFGTLIVASIALLVLGKADVRLLEAVNTRITDALTPVLDFAVQPINASRRLAETVGELLALRAENARLREQNARLLEWQSVARQLALENAALRQVLNAELEDEHPTAVTARVVGDAGGPFVQTVIVNAGADRGVVAGMAALNERGLVGRVIEVGRRSARDPAADRLQLAHPGDGRAVARPGDPRRRQQPRARPGVPADQPAPVGRRPRGHLGPRRRAAARARGRRGQRDRRAQDHGHAARRLGPPGLSAPARVPRGAAARAPLPSGTGLEQRELYGPPPPPEDQVPAAALSGGAAVIWLRQLDAQLRALVPFGSALLAVLFDVAPLVGSGPAGLTSFATLCVVYFWSLYRPDLFPASAAFVAGLVYDALAGLPLGLTSLVLLLVRNLMVTQQRFFLARSFPVIWFCFLLLAPAVELARWLLSSLWWGHLFGLQPALLELR